MAFRVEVWTVTDAVDALFAGRKETLSVPEVAELLGMTKQGIYHWLRDGVIPGYKVGTSWFILRDELKETLRAGANPRRPLTAEPADPAPPSEEEPDHEDTGGTG